MISEERRKRSVNIQECIMSHKRSITLILLSLLAALVLTLPVMAQDDTEESSLVLASGEVSFGENGEILVDGYIIAPAGAFIPAGLEEGDTVLIMGYLLPDGETIQALSLEFVEEEDEEADTEEEEEVVDEEEANDEEADEVEETDDAETDEERGFYCQSENGFLHPAGARLANQFDTSYNNVMTYFCEEQRGFGEIMLAHMLAEASGDDVELFMEARASGMGWGQIMQQNDMHPGEVFGRRVISSGPWGEGERPGGGPPADRPGAGPPTDRPGGGPPSDRPGGGPPGDRPGGGPPSDRPGGGRP
jgi:hypothetical protein